MNKFPTLLIAALLLSGSLAAQTRITITDVRALDGGDSLRGTDATVQLDKAEGAGNALILNTGGVIVKVHGRISTQHVQRSSMKDSAVNLDLEITMKAGKDKDTKHVQKIFYLDQQRTGTVTQRFNFKDGLRMRTITLTFNVAVE